MNKANAKSGELPFFCTAMSISLSATDFLITLLSFTIQVFSFPIPTAFNSKPINLVYYLLRLQAIMFIKTLKKKENTTRN